MECALVKSDEKWWKNVLKSKCGFDEKWWKNDSFWGVEIEIHQCKGEVKKLMKFH